MAHDHDAHGHVIAVRDRGTPFAYWRLTDVDNAGSFREEVFGNDAVTERSYFADKQRLRHMVTQSGAGEVQDLDYGYDVLLNLPRRTDASQPENTTERFRYDPLQRLTCTYFSDVERASAPCALRRLAIQLDDEYLRLVQEEDESGKPESLTLFSKARAIWAVVFALFYDPEQHHEAIYEAIALMSDPEELVRAIENELE
ncbi:hypothetical protein WMF38_31290 [Sorangium sp. So ce118]